MSELERDYFKIKYTYGSSADTQTGRYAFNGTSISRYGQEHPILGHGHFTQSGRISDPIQESHFSHLSETLYGYLDYSQLNSYITGPTFSTLKATGQSEKKDVINLMKTGISRMAPGIALHLIMWDFMREQLRKRTLESIIGGHLPKVVEEETLDVCLSDGRKWNLSSEKAKTEIRECEDGNGFAETKLYSLEQYD